MSVHNIQILRGLTGNRSLLSCTSDGVKVDLWSRDDGSGHQQWDIIQIGDNVYNIKVHAGVTTARVFLSCTNNGFIVDLYDRVDESGRQKWQLIPVQNSPTPNTFLIKVLSGVITNRVYLSCTSDSLKVDLFDRDDGSGRQRWQIQGVWQA